MKLFSILLAALALFAVPFTLACAGPPPLDPGGRSGPATIGELRVWNAQLSGSMGEIRDFRGGTSTIEGHFDPAGTWVRVDADGPSWWAMTGLTLDGDLMGPDYAPGTHRQYVSGIVSGDPTAPGADVMGCSGPAHGDYTYDTHSQTVELWVTGTSASRHLRYEVNFDGQITEGSFDFAMAPTGI